MKKHEGTLSSINSLEAKVEDLSDSDLVSLLSSLRSKPDPSKELETTFAVAREAAWRTLQLRPYDVQVLGGLTLHSSKVCQMATGEGKTLTTIFPALQAWVEGRGSFIVTTNDYLAKRDAGILRPAFEFLGLSVGLIQTDMKEEERKIQYQKDVVYVTNSELGFDYLRDHLSYTAEGCVMPDAWRKRFCLVDEADSIFIDEARTPLIISKSVETDGQKFNTATTLANALQPGIHYDVDLKKKNVILTEAGYEDCQRALKVESLFEVKDGGSWAGYVVNAVKAKELFKVGVDYQASADGSTVDIIDPFSGRALVGRKYADGLHQAVESKEGMSVGSQSRVIAKVTFQSFFKMFDRLSGMTGTAVSSAGELERVYGLEVVEVPTALPLARRDYPDVVFKTRNAADNALINEVLGVTPRPVLVGTTSVAQSERIASALTSAGVRCEVLNAEASNAGREAEIVAQAGRSGRVTVATNMAGRGTDIKLGGDASAMAKIYAKRRVVGGAEDGAEYPCEVGTDVEGLVDAAVNAMKKAGITAEKDVEDLVVTACDATEAEDDPSHLTAMREAVAAVRDKFDEVLKAEKEEVLAIGGLYVMGTNRHESVRVDMQLRGRSGRQGDPGSSRFFLSFEDDMVKVFGGDKMAKMLDVFRVSEDMPVEAKQVVEALDNVQRRVEEEYEEVREGVLGFDEVLDGQRQVIYQDRMEVLNAPAAEFDELFSQWAAGVVDDIVDGSKGDGDKVSGLIGQFFPVLAGGVLDPAQLGGKGAREYLKVAVGEAVAAKMGEQGEARDKWRKTARYLLLVSLDNAFQDHLGNMDSLIESVTLRGYRGLDPKVEYQQDGFELFKGLQGTLRRNSVYSIMNQ